MAGLATFPNQKHAAAIDAGFDLTLMVIGAFTWLGQRVVVFL